MSKISIVTAFFDIGRGDWTQDRGYPHYLERTTETYIERFSHLCGLSNEIVVYTSSDLVEKIEAIRKDNIEIIPIDFKGNFIEERTSIQKVHNNKKYLSCINPFQIKNPEYWSEDYVLVNYLKSYFVNDAIKNKLVNNDLVAWIDFGYCRSPSVLNNVKEWNYDFNKDKIHLFNFRDYLGQNITEIIFNNIVYMFGAKIIAGHERWSDFQSLMEQSFRDLINNDLVDDDQTLMLLSYLRNRDLFELHKIIESDPFIVFKEYNQ